MALEGFFWWMFHHIGSNIIEYITIASEGNPIDFGDGTQRRLTWQRYLHQLVFVIGGGESPYNKCN